MRRIIPFIFIITTLLTLIYTLGMQTGFAVVDDNWMLLNEKLVQTSVFSLKYIAAVFTRINSSQYSPLNTLWYAVVYQIDGYDPYYFHVFSLALHFLNTVLVYVLVKKILATFSVSNFVYIAYAICITWAVLPFNVQAVVWIAASKVLLYTFWGNLSFILFIKAYTERLKWAYWFSIVALILSCLAKEQAVLYGLMVVLFVYTHQIYRSGTFNLKQILKATTPYLVVALAFGLSTLYISTQGSGSLHVKIYPFYQRFVLAFYCIWFYVLNCFVPTNLKYQYEFPMKYGLELPLLNYFYPIVILLISWLGYLFIKKSKNKIIYVLGIGIFLIHLLLCIQIVPLPRGSMLGDRYMYVPSIGLLLVAFIALNEKFNLNFKKLNKHTFITLMVFGLYVLALSTYSYTLVNKWQSLQY